MTIVLTPLGAALVVAFALWLLFGGTLGVLLAGPSRLVATCGLAVAMAGGGLLIALCAGVS